LYASTFFFVFFAFFLSSYETRIKNIYAEQFLLRESTVFFNQFHRPYSLYHTYVIVSIHLFGISISINPFPPAERIPRLLLSHKRNLAFRMVFIQRSYACGD
jgi:hypothetical protein